MQDIILLAITIWPAVANGGSGCLDYFAASVNSVGDARPGLAPGP